MQGDNATFDLAQAQLNSYGKSSESWKEDYEAAQKCLDFEAYLVFGISLYRSLNTIDAAWRTKVYRGELAYDASMEDKMLFLYKLWTIPCKRAFARLEYLERQGFDVTGAKEFRLACQEVAGILTPREEFYAGNDGLVERQELAVAEYHKGQTVEMKEFGD